LRNVQETRVYSRVAGTVSTGAGAGSVFCEPVSNWRNSAFEAAIGPDPLIGAVAIDWQLVTEAVWLQGHAPLRLVTF
jgi:hypothetical protein